MTSFGALVCYEKYLVNWCKQEDAFSIVSTKDRFIVRLLLSIRWAVRKVRTHE